MSRARARALVLALVATGCGDRSSTDDFGWHVDLADLDGAMLGVWTGDDQVIATGAYPAGWTLECEAIDLCQWREPGLPDGTGMLWWVWGERPFGDAWTVGGRATILHRGPVQPWVHDEPAAGVVDSATTMYGVWGTATEVWVVGGVLTPGPPPGVILHRDAAGWTLEHVADQPLFKVWGTSATDVWAVGEHGTIVHRDATGAWAAVASGTTDRLIAVSGRAADDVFAVGGNDAGVLLHWNGSAWSRYAEVTAPLAAVWTAPGRALYVGGAGGYLERFGATDTADPDPSARASTIVDAGVDIHSLAGSDRRVIAVGADLHGGGAMRHGLVASHGAALGGAPPAPHVDASIADAPIDGPPADAALVDAAPPPDADGPANGEPCQLPPAMVCATGYTCLPAETETDLICTQFCSDVTECTAYGTGACCAIGFPQVGAPYCLPAQYCP